MATRLRVGGKEHFDARAALAHREVLESDERVWAGGTTGFARKTERHPMAPAVQVSPALVQHEQTALVGHTPDTAYSRSPWRLTKPTAAVEVKRTS